MDRLTRSLQLTTVNLAETTTAAMNVKRAAAPSRAIETIGMSRLEVKWVMRPQRIAIQLSAHMNMRKLRTESGTLLARALPRTAVESSARKAWTRRMIECSTLRIVADREDLVDGFGGGVVLKRGRLMDENVVVVTG